MRRSIFIFIFLAAFVALGQSSSVVVVNDTNAPVPVVVADVGDALTAQDWFLTGLEYGSGIAAILFGFISVRRALSIGDSWND